MNLHLHLLYLICQLEIEVQTQHAMTNTKRTQNNRFIYSYKYKLQRLNPKVGYKIEFEANIIELNNLNTAIMLIPTKHVFQSSSSYLREENRAEVLIQRE